MAGGSLCCLYCIDLFYRCLFIKKTKLKIQPFAFLLPCLAPTLPSLLLDAGREKEDPRTFPRFSGEGPGSQL